MHERTQFPAQDARLAAVFGQIENLRAIASELFAGPIQVAVETDPEIDGMQYVALSVEAHADLTEVASKRREWYRKTEALLGADCELVELFVDVRE